MSLSIFSDNDLDETKQTVKASHATLYAMHAVNLTAAPLYLQLFNKLAADVTVGTTVPDAEIVLPGEANSDGVAVDLSIPAGIAFGVGIVAAVTTTSRGSGAPAANAAHVNLFYK